MYSYFLGAHFTRAYVAVNVLNTTNFWRTIDNTKPADVTVDATVKLTRRLLRPSL